MARILCCKGILKRPVLIISYKTQLNISIFMETEGQDTEQPAQDLEDLLNPRGGQSTISLFSEEDKQESLQIETLDP